MLTSSSSEAHGSLAHWSVTGHWSIHKLKLATLLCGKGLTRRGQKRETTTRRKIRARGCWKAGHRSELPANLFLNRKQRIIHQKPRIAISRAGLKVLLCFRIDPCGFLARISRSRISLILRKQSEPRPGFFQARLS